MTREPTTLRNSAALVSWTEVWTWEAFETGRATFSGPKWDIFLGLDLSLNGIEAFSCKPFRGEAVQGGRLEGIPPTSIELLSLSLLRSRNRINAAHIYAQTKVRNARKPFGLKSVSLEWRLHRLQCLKVLG